MSLDKLGIAMRRLREARGLTQQEVARRMGIADSSVGRLENGNPTARNIGRYLEALGGDLHDLAASLDEVAGRPSSGAVQGGGWDGGEEEVLEVRDRRGGLVGEIRRRDIRARPLPAEEELDRALGRKFDEMRDLLQGLARTALDAEERRRRALDRGSPGTARATHES